MAIVLRNISRIFWQVSRRSFSDQTPKYVLGIETSCDETASAIVDEKGTICGEAVNSQLSIHLDFGGIIPHIASYFHQKSIESVVNSTVKNSGLDFKDISAFAVTVKPGLRASLLVGLEHAKHLARQHGKPLIPIHHMEAHTFTARIVEPIEFPFLVLLASGGHCQIAIVNNLTEFLLLGTAQNNTPGELLDKVARRLKLGNLLECRDMSGGRAIEHMAKDGNLDRFKFPPSMTAHRDCNFSFSGCGAFAIQLIEDEEKAHNIAADGVIPTAKDVCASVQHAFAIHILHRVERAFHFCSQKNLIPDNKKTLVFSGGVACNQYIRGALSELCRNYDYHFVSPPPKLCTDNGIMIAWNGMEKYKEGIDVYHDFDHIGVDPDASLGTDYTEAVKEASIKVKVPKYNPHSKSSTGFEQLRPAEEGLYS